jgi:hypothetical protein
VVAEVAEDAVQPRRVDLGVIDEEQDEKAGDALVVEKLAASVEVEALVKVILFIVIFLGSKVVWVGGMVLFSFE